jgi:LysR family transcriptional activator of nhaA
MHWFDQLGIRPYIVGEFEDWALMQAFAQSGVGVFMSPSVIDAEIAQQHRVAAIGSTTGTRGTTPQALAMCARVRVAYYTSAG